MATDNVNDLNNSAENIREAFAEISNLVDELNKNLTQTVNLTQNVNNNLSRSTDQTKEQVREEATRESIQKRMQSLSNDELKALKEGLKTGKGLTKELAAKIGLEGKAGTLAGTAAKMKAQSLGLTEKQVKRQILLNEAQAVSNKLQGLSNRILDEFVKQLLAADKETTQIARNLNLSKEEAVDLKQEFAVAALQSGDIAVNSIRMAKAMGTLNEQLGTAVRFNDEMLMTTSKLTDVVGLSAEAAGSLAFQAQISGNSLREVEENALGASYELQQGAGIALNMKGILEATGKVSGQLRAQLNGNPEIIAKAVTQAKLLGAEINDIANASKQLLDFENSIEAELEAELLTGKQLNLERARAAALAGDQATVAEELAKNMGTFGDFTKMNTLQQDALAKSMGMSSDALSDMLFKQETMGMNAEQLRAVGKGELADRLEQLDTQERLQLAQEKFQATLGDIATAFIPFMDMVSGVAAAFASMPGVMGALLGIIGTLVVAQKVLAAISMVTAVAKIFGENAKAGPIVGTIAALAGVAALFGAVAMSKQKVRDGIAPASKGPFTITDNYGGMATTTPGDNLQVGPKVGAKSSPTPIVIQNNWDAFAASNGNGRRGLGGTQEMQASPTFA